ncbi:ABC transporter permease [Halodesulfovibrio marinisediminis]|uniref:Iron(III) transport system permease protein n=1 Tax=Halodesulfovibrio marinisediminis DSM 17456 TaxID=1121457 RepID=A0A1N6DVW4_9BACT|nr:iron ABC transporter permease [Halodesulfovibrio marinisediminis]SIN74929.1 iron(III) transport system permease protein [Halodesulfovibrio marinisediminis DSM 17456]
MKKIYSKAIPLTVAALALTPIIVIFSSALQPRGDLWAHLLQTSLPTLALNTLSLCLGVAIGTGILGVVLGWLIAACEFPGRRFFSTALLLPMAIPTYVFAFVFLGLFDFSSPLQLLLRDWFGTVPFDVRSVWTVCIIMTLALYPYVYVMAKSGFTTQGQRCLEAARTLGCSTTTVFYSVALPLCRPWIATGILLVLMETLADFGAVSVFNFDTFTTAVYKAWYGFFSLSTASQLASILVLLALVLLSSEQRLRRKMRFTQEHSQFNRIPLSGTKAIAACIFCCTIFFIGFLLPVIQLALWSLDTLSIELSSRYITFSTNTLMLGLLAAGVTCLGALALAYAARFQNTKNTQWLISLSTIGYSLPGTVLAVGIIAPVAYFDNVYIQVVSWITEQPVRPLLQGTILTLLIAYAVRFMAAAYGSINSNMQRITPSMDDASILMGVTGWKMLRKVHLPQLKTGIFTAALLVLVDVMKEMPITLMTRPFGWDTLAVKIYELTSEGEWERAAIPAILLILVGLIPVLCINQKTDSV